MRSSINKSYIAAIALLLQPSAHGVTLFSDQTSFLNAAGSVTTENFESSTLSGSETSGALSSLNFNFLAVSSTPPSVKLLGIILSNGNHNTTLGGSRYLSFDTDQGSVSADATLIFNLPQSISALGFFLIDVEEGVSVSINGIDYLVSPTSDGDVTYFGIISESPFATVLLDAGVNDSQWSIDDMAVKMVPEPTMPVLIIVSIVMFGRQSRR